MSLTAQATGTAEQIHLQDRQTLQDTLGSLGEQYLLFSLKEGLDFASTGTWDVRAADAGDTARLQTFVAHAVLLNYGAALVDLAGNVLSEYVPNGGAVPPASDPGYGPMIRDLLGHHPDVSSVMTVGAVHVAAMGVPVTVGDQTRAVFVGYVRLDTSSLETYVRTLHLGMSGRFYVTDSIGTVVAATDPKRIGHPLPYRQATTQVDLGRSGNYIDGRGHDVVVYAAFGLGGWGGVMVQGTGDFYGSLRSGRLHVELAIAGLLIVASVVVLVLNHMRQVARRRYQQELAFQAAHDGLTGLYNHVVFYERLGQALARAVRRHSDVAVLYLDLDRFKAVNDRFGHETGDRVLAEVAGRLHAVTRAEDLVARMGGDEFAVLVEDLHSPAAIEPLASRIVEDLSRPVRLSAGEAVVGVSIGIVYSSRGVDDAESIVRHADLAMYRAKEEGGNRHKWAVAPEVIR
jgi:diguanylate cyclase (GGDEF)-like protein